MIVTPARRHRCAPPKRPRPVQTAPTVMAGGKRITGYVCAEPGTLWRCDKCRRWWCAYETPNRNRGGGYTSRGSHWEPVHWYNLALKKRIARAEAEENASIVAAWQPSAITRSAPTCPRWSTGRYPDTLAQRWSMRG